MEGEREREKERDYIILNLKYLHNNTFSTPSKMIRKEIRSRRVKNKSTKKKKEQKG